MTVTTSISLVTFRPLKNILIPLRTNSEKTTVTNSFHSEDKIILQLATQEQFLDSGAVTGTGANPEKRFHLQSLMDMQILLCVANRPFGVIILRKRNISRTDTCAHNYWPVNPFFKLLLNFRRNNSNSYLDTCPYSNFKNQVNRWERWEYIERVTYLMPGGL